MKSREGGREGERKKEIKRGGREGGREKERLEEGELTLQALCSGLYSSMVVRLLLSVASGLSITSPDCSMMLC